MIEVIRKVPCIRLGIAEKILESIPVYGGSTSLPLSRTTITCALLEQSFLPPHLHGPLNPAAAWPTQEE